MAGVLVSVHLPKTAGTSFQQVLEQGFGACLVRDDGDRPLHHRRVRVCARAAAEAMSGALGLPVGSPAVRALPVLQRDSVAARLGTGAARGLRAAPDTAATTPNCCIHGHFLPLKYRWLRSAGPLYFVTWLREPVARLLSHYYYWQRNYDPTRAGALHQRVVHEAWSLERFCLSADVRNLYSRFLWGFPLQRFAFIGVVEHFGEDLQRLQAMGLLGRARLSEGIEPPRVNARPADCRPHLATEAAIEAPLRRRIEAFHARDVALYRSAVHLRERALSRSPLGFPGA